MNEWMNGRKKGTNKKEKEGRACPPGQQWQHYRRRRRKRRKRRWRLLAAQLRAPINWQQIQRHFLSSFRSVPLCLTLMLILLFSPPLLLPVRWDTRSEWWWEWMTRTTPMDSSLWLDGPFVSKSTKEMRSKRVRREKEEKQFVSVNVCAMNE